MVARQRQSAAALVPDRDRERPAQHRPKRVAEFFPAGEQHARIRPRPRLTRRDADPLQHLVAIVEPQVGGDQRPARALPRLAIELVFRRHAHQHVDETDAVGDRHVGAIRTVLAQRIRRAFEAMPGHGAAVEAQQSGNRAHGNAPPNVAMRRKSIGLGTADDFVVADLDPGMGAECIAIARDAETKPARDAAPAQHGVRRQRARQTQRIDPGFCAEIFDGPRDPGYFVDGKAADAPRRLDLPRQRCAPSEQTARRAVPGRA